MKIITIAPFLKEEGGNKEFKSRENLGIAYLTSYLKNKGYDADMLNAHDKEWNNKEIMSYLKDRSEYKIIGVSCTSQRLYPYVRELIKMCRKEYPDSYIVTGGIFPTMEYRNVMEDLPELDLIMLGEGEVAYAAIADWYIHGTGSLEEIHGIVYRNKNDVVVNDIMPVKNYDGRPFPIREKIDFNKYEEKFLRLLGGRGCYGRCAFCSTIKCLNEFNINRGKVYRDVEDIVEEIEYLIKETGIHSFSFYDDIFYDRSKKGLEWINELVALLKERKLNIDFNIKMRTTDITDLEIKGLSEVGLTTVFLGVESGIQRILDEMRKDATVEDSIKAVNILRKYNVKIVYGYMGIIPTMSFEELKENLDFIVDLGGYTERNLYNKLNLYSGCEYNEILENEGLLIKSNNFWSRNNYTFKDKRVEYYSECVDEIKQELKHYKVMINRIKMLWLNNSDIEFDKIEGRYISDWVVLLYKTIDYIKGLCDKELDCFCTESLFETLKETLSSMKGYVQKYYDLYCMDLSQNEKEQMDQEFEE